MVVGNMSRVWLQFYHTFLGVTRKILPQRPVEVVLQRKEEGVRRPQQLVAQLQGRFVKPQALLEVLISMKTGRE